ncbi:type II toxin-antitoxin system PemK/MazF family toxin [Microtetraspora sp. AC03309]|uniref:type II toxin-antitoxin system PemK/MazF family toxin n=1 Tax=Microtetraspora sp. AC03309 TaxID=2779376 RepID=UPI001E2A8366|nr:type II toxin-antitoxin system PemK/MazF family toxin [Microtetraspora sp. AC03309]MCC5577629.1 type II toxin-antitoxin system PemK/MazF family toxin [Microtetraspora sp. AC03309]
MPARPSRPPRSRGCGVGSPPGEHEAHANAHGSSAKALKHEQSGERFAVVIQSDFIPALSTLLVAPTSTSARPTSFRPEIELLGKSTRVMLETASVAPERLGSFAGRLSPAEPLEIDEALHLVFGLVR